MARKIISISLAFFLCCACLSSTTQAASYTVYDGNMSSSYITYFRDILSNCSINDNYVCFRNSQYEYCLIVGDMDYVDGNIETYGYSKVYTISNDTTLYNSYFSYSVSDIDSSTIVVGDNIVYSDCGNFPQLETRGDKFEILQTIILVTVCLCIVIRSIFYYRKRR